MQVVSRIVEEISNGFMKEIDKELKRMFEFAGIRAKNEEGNFRKPEEVQKEMEERNAEVDIMSINGLNPEKIITLKVNGEIKRQTQICLRYSKHKVTIFTKRLK